MAPLGYRIVSHGVYTIPFFVNPTAATKSGCTQEDVDLLLKIIPYAYSHTASYVRPSVGVRHAWYIEHKSILGSCSDFDLLDALTPKKKKSRINHPFPGMNMMCLLCYRRNCRIKLGLCVIWLPNSNGAISS